MQEHSAKRNLVCYAEPRSNMLHVNFGPVLRAEGVAQCYGVGYVGDSYGNMPSPEPRSSIERSASGRVRPP